MPQLVSKPGDESQRLRIRRRNVNAPALTSNSAVAKSPHGVSVGAGAVVLAQIPTRLVRLQRIDGSVQAVLQQTPSTQKPVEHNEGVEHAPPIGMGVLVGVAVGVLVGVLVGVFVGVLLGVKVGVLVGVLVGVWVGVADGTGTPSIT